MAGTRTHTIPTNDSLLPPSTVAVANAATGAVDNDTRQRLAVIIGTTQMTPSICGSFLGSKRALLAFTWTLTTIMTFVAFLTAVAFVIQINTHYRYLERTYGDGSNGRALEEREQHSQDNENNNNNNKAAAEAETNWYPILARTSSGAMTFASIYIIILATALQIYGSTAIVGFTSLKGAYIAPCFPNRNRLKIGILGGAVVVFANMLLLTAVIFGEFRVDDYRENVDDLLPYAVERIATVLAVTCMFLSVLYATFAVLLFLAYASDSPSSLSLHSEEDSRTKPLADHRHQQFITIT